MILSLAILFGIIPSLIWLAFYLRTDVHPEPNRMVLKVFFWGMLATIPAIIIELSIRPFLVNSALLGEALAAYIYIFLGIAFVEEVLKYSVFHFAVLHNTALDEVIDIPLYMIIGALGFAALENIFILAGLGPTASGGDVVALSAFRFVGATLLHALVSGIFGYFIALAVIKPKHRGLLLFVGLAAATILHGLFNLYIITGEEGEQFLYPAVLLTGMAVFLSLALRQLKRVTKAI